MFDSCRYAIAASYALEYGVNLVSPAALRGRKDIHIDFNDVFG